ncbi:hypothetical protein EG327_011375 [Venturia inaequalis]|uniref:Uncharacterized protein n=1 Tax=Venturia inaequalis TaxID=5025 RepID=A0A8H3UFB6_VENIN|nr:hypothetical protein EG327_011375 [Venturia inaequalis]
MPNFMDLSGELRNKIYRYCFVLDAFVNASSKGNMWTYYYRHKEISEASSQFLRVSKIIYHEGSSILYGGNRIYAQDYDDLKTIVERIGLNALYVRELKLDYDPDTVCLSRMFAGFHNLNKLYFTRGNEVEENTVLHAQHTLGLCPQLRNKVYRNLFIFDKAIDLDTGIIVREALMGQRTVEEDSITYWSDIRPRDFTDPKHKLRYPASSQILRVSRQLYEEGASILYGENRFYVDNIDDLKRIGTSSEQRLVYIKELVVRCSFKKDIQIEIPSPLISFPSLQDLTFITGFCEHYDPFISDFTFAEKLDGPDEGSKVSMSYLRLPAKFPSLSRLFLYNTIVERGVEVCLEVWLSRQHQKRTIWEERGVDCYRVLPVSPDSPPNSSLIQREYDLVFEEFFELS